MILTILFYFSIFLSYLLTFDDLFIQRRDGLSVLHQTLHSATSNHFHDCPFHFSYISTQLMSKLKSNKNGKIPPTHPVLTSTPTCPIFAMCKFFLPQRRIGVGTEYPLSNHPYSIIISISSSNTPFVFFFFFF